MLSTLSSKWWRLSPVILSTPWSYLCIFKHLWQSGVSQSTTAVYHLSIMLHIFLNSISAKFSLRRGNCIFSSLIALLKVRAIIGSYPRSLYLCNRWSDWQCEPGGISCSLPKDQIIYSTSASFQHESLLVTLIFQRALSSESVSSICSFSRLFNLVFWEYLVNPWWYMLIICLPIPYQWKNMEDHLCLLLSSFENTACVQSSQSENSDFLKSPISATSFC